MIAGVVQEVGKCRGEWALRMCGNNWRGGVKSGHREVSSRPEGKAGGIERERHHLHAGRNRLRSGDLREVRRSSGQGACR